MNRFGYSALFLIIILAAFLRLWGLCEIPPGLYHDEAINMNQAREAWREGDFNIFYPENNGREGLFINIQALSLAAFGNTPFAARLPSALFGILTVLGVFFLTKELFKSDRVALFASFLLATSFWHINFSRIGFRAIMAPFFLVWSMYFVWKLVNADKLNAKRSTLNATIGGLLFGLGFHSYIAYRVAPLLLIVPFIAGWRIYKSSSLSSRNIDISIFRMRGNCLPCLLALFLFFAFVAALPLGIYFLEYPADFTGRSAQVSIFSSETPLNDLGENILTTFGMFFWHGDYNWRHNLSASLQLWWPISILFLIGFSRSFYALRVTGYWLLSWFFVFLIPVVLSNEGLPHALRALPLIIPAVIFAAMGLEWIVNNVLRWIKKKKGESPDAIPQLNRLPREFALLLFVFLIAVATHGFNQYFLRWARNPHVYAAFNDNYANLGRYVAALPSATKKYIIVNTPGHMLVDNIPMPAQTVMFFTDTWNRQKRNEKKFVYIPLLRQDLKGQASLFARLPQNIRESTIIAMLENDPTLHRELKARYPELISKITNGGLILTNF